MSSYFSSFSSYYADGIHVDDDSSSFDLADYILGDDETPPVPPPEYPNLVLPVISENRDDEMQQPVMSKTKNGPHIAFRTQTEIDILDDGFKWRKYGKKSVKNRPNNPRNYYRCSSERCPVKKRVERDQEDPNYVITTYIGSHNHTSPVVHRTAHDTGSSSLSGSSQVR